MALVELARFTRNAEADLARLLLEGEGLEVVLFDQGISMALGGAMPVRLMVHREDAEEAARLLADEGLL